MELYSGPSSNSDRSISPYNKKMEAANELAELERRLEKGRRIKQQIADCEHAIEKIKKGSYGFCDNCGKSIAEERLKAIPQASLCFKCKASQQRILLSSHAR